MVCIPVMDPSHTLPVSWVRITEAWFDTAQGASQKHWSTQGQGPHKWRLQQITQFGQAPFLRSRSLQCAMSQWTFTKAENENGSS